MPAWPQGSGSLVGEDMGFKRWMMGIRGKLIAIFVVMVVIDCVYVGRLVNKRAAQRYPESTDGGFKLGWYAASRTLQMRRLRVPKPQVERGEAV